MKILSLALMAPLIILVLTGCGGGGGSSDDAAPVATIVQPETQEATQTTNQTAGETTVPIEKTSDLTASEMFSFTSSSQISVNLDLEAYASADAYLTICSKFSTTEKATDIDYGSCLLQAPLLDGRYQGELSLPNDIDKLIIAIWQYNGDLPDTTIWSRSQAGDSINL